MNHSSLRQAALPSSTQQSSNTTPTTSTNQGTKAAKLAQAANTSHKVTEYFPIRRSERKPKAELLKEQMELNEEGGNIPLVVMALPCSRTCHVPTVEFFLL